MQSINCMLLLPAAHVTAAAIQLFATIAAGVNVAQLPLPACHLQQMRCHKCCLDASFVLSMKPAWFGGYR